MTSPVSDPKPSWGARSYRLRLWVIDHAPLPLLTHAHEVGLSVALIFVSAPLLSGAPEPDSVYSQTPYAMAQVWAWTLLVSSLLTLWGQFGNRPRIEWAGQLFMGYALTFYAAALVAFAGFQGFLASAIFGVLGLVAWWRSFKITNQPLVQHRLVNEARRAHEAVHTERVNRARKGRA